MCHFFVFTTFDVLCNVLLNRRTAIWNVFVKMLIVIKVYGQGRIQEFMIWGVQTLDQEGLLNFYVANYLSPTSPSTSRGCAL